MYTFTNTVKSLSSPHRHLFDFVLTFMYTYISIHGGVYIHKLTRR